MPVLRTNLPPGQRIPRNLPGITDQTDLGPATPSPDYEAMEPYWHKVEAIVTGVEALKAGQQDFLPKHPEELDEDYNFRLNNAVLTNIFKDIIDTLSAKPFSEELTIVDGSASTTFIGDPAKGGKRKGGLIEDIDGKGNHLHVFAHEVFYNGINKALDWIFVDYPDVNVTLSVKDERERNIRPYWFRVSASDVLEVDSVMVGGEEVLIYVRYFESAKVRNGFKSEYKTRVREIVRPEIVDATGNKSYGIPTWTLWELQETTNTSANIAVEKTWKKIKTGTYTIGEIPMVPFICGKRKGSTWQFDPVMKSAAELQIELYQMETGLKNCQLLVCYPMLTANGVNLKDDRGDPIRVIIGPHTILNAPPSPDGSVSGSWSFIEPGSESLRFVAERVEAMKQELRELGRQPLTANSGNLTVITAAFASDKANAAVQAWALMLKDTLENALALTAKWLNDDSEPEVVVHTDFVLDLNSTDMPVLQGMRDKGDLSQDTLWQEAKRRGVLSADFDAEQERKRLTAEVPSMDETTAAAGTQLPVKPTNGSGEALPPTN